MDEAVEHTKPMLILRDWDQQDAAECVPALLAKVVAAPPAPHIAVRIAVRAIESWLMADASAASEYFGISAVPIAPDDLPNPKRELLTRCRSSTKREIREGLVSRDGGVGALHTGLVTDFGRDHWDLTRARRNSPSLDRSVARIEQLRADGPWT